MCRIKFLKLQQPFSGHKYLFVRIKVFKKNNFLFFLKPLGRDTFLLENFSLVWPEYLVQAREKFKNGPNFKKNTTICQILLI